ncbi:MAG: AMIN domain-containing protein [Desulfobulbaceae bacterium]|jgi:outer membrane biosynthesis protein TonB|nr:AMIN domain-containing protein [Desulfobulbaceae bacterium]
MKTFAHIFLLAMLLSCAPKNALSAVLERVTNQSLEDGREVVNLFFDGTCTPTIFSLDGKSPRLVFDFPGARYLGRQKIGVRGAALQSIRIATHQNPMKTRVVFDLPTDMEVDYSQEFIGDSHTLRVTLFRKGLAQNALTPTEKILASAQPAPRKEADRPSEPTPRQTETATPDQSASRIKSQETPRPTAEKEKPTQSSESAPTSEPTPKSSPFDRPFAATEPPAESSGKTTGDAVETPGAARMFGYSLTTQPTPGGDVLRMQLDGYASPEISARDGRKPQIICFFPHMRLAVKKGLNQPMSGKFVQKVAVTAQKKPVGVKMTLDLEDGYDYDIQQVFVKDESAFLLIVNVFNH